MSFLIYLHKGEFQPEDPQILDGHLKPDTQLTFVDFIPSITKRSATSIISGTEIEYHPFKKMVETANEWLNDNKEYDVVNCETTKIMFKFNDSQNYYDLRYNDVSHYIYGTEKNNLLKALRVWVKRKDQDARSENAANESTNANNQDAGYVTDSLSPDTPQQESPKLDHLSSVLKRRWTQPQQQFQKTPNKLTASKAQIPPKSAQKNSEIHSTDHSPVKKNAFQQQQAFRLQQYSSQSKFFLNKLQRQASCPPSRDTFQTGHAAQQSTSAQNSPVYNAKQSHNQHSSNQQANQQAHSVGQTGQQTSGQSAGGSSPAVVLNYIDIVPECNEENENSKFERLDDCLRKLNRLIRDGEIAGRILNVETGSCEATVKWKIDTEISFTALTSKNVNFLRCFYVENERPDTNERIRIQDFVPDHLSAAGFFKRPRFESFSLLVPKLTEWLVNNPECKFKGAQTLDIKLKSYVSQSQTELIDTKSMHFTEHGDYLRILRLVYSETVSDPEEEASMKEQLVSINQEIIHLLDAEDIEEIDSNKKKSSTLIKQDSDTSGQSGSNDLMSRSTNLESNSGEEHLKEKRTEAKQSGEDAERDSVADCDKLVKKLREFSAEDKRQIYLSSKLFLCHRKGQTINDLKQEIQEWSKNYQLETRSKNANPADLAKPRILACETIQLFCKQNFFEMNKNNDFTYLQKASEETFMYNRFGLKNGYLVNAFRVYFDVGWFAWNRLGYAQKLSYAQKLRRKRFNYSTSVDDEHLKETTTVPAPAPPRPKPLNRRESVGDFYQGKKQSADLVVSKGSLNAARRRSCIEKSLEDDYEMKAKDGQIFKLVQGFDKKQGKELENLGSKLAGSKQTNGKESGDKSASKSTTVHHEISVDQCKDDKDSLMLESEFSDFSSLSLLANVSNATKLESSNSSLSTSNEESKFLNVDEKGLGFKRKIRKINNFKQQSVDNQDNCLLM